MQSLEYGFSQFHEKTKPKAAIVVLSEVDSGEMDKAHSRYKNEIAKVLMHCKEYAELNFEDKVNISEFGVHFLRGIRGKGLSRYYVIMSRARRSSS